MEVIGLATGHAGIVGDTYTPFQNESLTDYLQTMTDESGAFLDTAADRARFLTYSIDAAGDARSSWDSSESLWVCWLPP